MDLLEAVRATQKRLDALKTEFPGLSGVVHVIEGDAGVHVAIMFFPNGTPPKTAASIGMRLEPGCDVHARADAVHQAARDFMVDHHRKAA